MKGGLLFQLTNLISTANGLLSFSSLKLFKSQPEPVRYGLGSIPHDQYRIYWTVLHSLTGSKILYSTLYFYLLLVELWALICYHLSRAILASISSVHYSLPPVCNVLHWCLAGGFVQATTGSCSEKDSDGLVHVHVHLRNQDEVSTYRRISLSYVIVGQQFKRSRTHPKVSATQSHLPSS